MVNCKVAQVRSKFQPESLQIGRVAQEFEDKMSIDVAIPKRRFAQTLQRRQTFRRVHIRFEIVPEVLAAFRSKDGQLGR
jgi:hypothetical protein